MYCGCRPWKHKASSLQLATPWGGGRANLPKTLDMHFPSLPLYTLLSLSPCTKQPTSHLKRHATPSTGEKVASDVSLFQRYFFWKWN